MAAASGHARGRTYGSKAFMLIILTPCGAFAGLWLFIAGDDDLLALLHRRLFSELIHLLASHMTAPILSLNRG